MKPIFEVSNAWKQTYPQACAGVLAIRDARNPARDSALETEKASLQARLLSRWQGKDRAAMNEHPILQAYQSYYRSFKKTYHVQLQLESVVFKGKSLPRVSALVDAMFMAELENMLLTAGHDLDAVNLPIRLGVASGDEQYTLLRGTPQLSKAGDMIMFDRDGVISSIIYGPDQRTKIGEYTENVIYTVYAPPGVSREHVERHLEVMKQYVLLVSPQAQVALSQVFGAA